MITEINTHSGNRGTGVRAGVAVVSGAEVLFAAWALDAIADTVPGMAGARAEEATSSFFIVVLALAEAELGGENKFAQADSVTHARGVGVRVDDRWLRLRVWGRGVGVGVAHGRGGWLLPDQGERL